jgi:hypothetical protein
MKKRTRDLVLMLLIGVLFGASIATLWRSRGESLEMGDNASTPDTVVSKNGIPGATSTASLSPTSVFPLPPSIPANTRVGLSVSNQPAGKMVTVSNLSVQGTKWVAIYDERDGRPGWILGATRVHEGDTDTIVNLLRPEGTVKGNTYFAAILNDDGDGEFNRLTDLPPLSPDKITIVYWRAE